jgi:MarR-like DNA-binding transcriptional regulator SgrR of sgrS sRNA
MLESLEKSLQHASVQAVEVAELAGCSVRYAKDLLNEMTANGLIESRIVGNVRTYRLKK